MTESNAALLSHPLRKLFAPQSVAIVGASSDPERLTGRTLRYLQAFGYRGAIHPVNPKADAVAGLPVHRDIAEIEGPLDLAILSVRANLIPGVMRACADKQVPFVLIYSSGFSETGNNALQEEVSAIAREGGIRVLGPNCQGLVNLAEGIPLTFSGALYEAPRPVTGHVALVSQSGAFGFSSFGVGMEHGVRFRYVVTTGNQSDLDAVECADYVLEDPEVRLLMLYLEGLEDGAGFLRLVRRARERGIAVAVLKAGRSPSAREAAKSHTAALTGDERVWSAVFSQYGVIPMEDIDDIIGIGQVLGAEKRMKGGSSAILTTSGGAGIVMADCLNDVGLSVPEFSPLTRTRIEAAIPPFGASRNPVDMTVQISEQPENFRSVFDAVQEDAELDSVVTSLSMIVGRAGDVMTDIMIESYGRSPKPQAAVWMIDHQHGGRFIERLKGAGIPIFQSFRQCARAMKALKRWGTFEPPLAPRFDASEPILPDWEESMTEYDAKVFLSRYGIPVTRERLCLNLEEACDAAEELGFPVALKGMAASVLHKTEAGIVALDVRSFEELRSALKTVRSHLAEHVGDRGVQGFLVSEMVRGGFECIVGVKRDPVFGPMIAVGLGGIYVEVLGDVSLRHGAVDEDEALDMIRQIKGYSFLSGTRGSRPRDIRALARIVSRVSQLAVTETGLLELDINPVFVLEEGKGAVAADALVVKAQEA
ncbi:acetate--CoA ligase family protein [Fretibacterium sp. OH1220_COT-178]|uniref:acetate--CoA ligase family protein n=1 Tax=Fretibacterium sp. OH1220_COT-178 TaxID=2491047 RepID=UPI000F5FF0FE|nr:acetate--CoA ligase family protein [Fretibacterium sp. OH1220_COT-178]RRD64771.1 CoA-binding protein [Fretibacterium sp. OH1220_COT-178]